VRPFENIVGKEPQLGGIRAWRITSSAGSAKSERFQNIPQSIACLLVCFSQV